MMHKIGDQFVLLTEIFSIGGFLYFDGCTIYVYICSKHGALLKVIFKAISSDNCSANSATPQSLIDRTKTEIQVLISAIEQLHKH
jgi:hypothetical protein